MEESTRARPGPIGWDGPQARVRQHPARHHLFARCATVEPGVGSRAPIMSARCTGPTSTAAAKPTPL